MRKARSIDKSLLAKEQSEGVGARVRRMIGNYEVPQLDPFLMLDYFNARPPAGFPDHPHRGFETVTLVVNGSCIHEDFNGNKGIMKAGDLQLMTAGRGMVHCEMPGPDGTEGLQLWVNLPREKKMIPGGYHDIKSKDVPVRKVKGATIRECLSETTKVRTHVPTFYLDISLEPDVEHEQEVPEDWNALAYVYTGEVVFGPLDSEQKRSKGHTVTFKLDGDSVRVRNIGMDTARVMLIAGKPLNEPISRHGPFVMNTAEEIQEAIEDYQGGRNGFEKKVGWKSDHLRRMSR